MSPTVNPSLSLMKWKLSISTTMITPLPDFSIADWIISRPLSRPYAPVKLSKSSLVSLPLSSAISMTRVRMVDACCTSSASSSALTWGRRSSVRSLIMTSVHCASHWVPRPLCSSFRIASFGRCFLYTRLELMASYASATAMILAINGI